MRSLSYMTGVVISDFCLYLIPTVAFILVIIFLNIRAYSYDIGEFIAVMFIFGIDYICLCNFVGFFFKNVDKAFKNSIIIMSVIGFLFPNANVLFDYFLDQIDQTHSLSNFVNWFVLIVSPFSSVN